MPERAEDFSFASQTLCIDPVVVIIIICLQLKSLFHLKKKSAEADLSYFQYGCIGKKDLG